MEHKKSDEILFNLIRSFCSEVKSKTEPILRIKGAADYYRWLKYTPEFMKEKIDSLIVKSEYHLTKMEYEELKNYFDERNILKQLEAYFRGDILNLKYKDLKNYINSHPLSSIIASRLTPEEIESAQKKCEELINNNHMEQFGSLLFDDEQSILDFAPDSMTDFYAMELYSGYCKNDINTRLSDDACDAYKRNSKAAGKSRIFS